MSSMDCATAREAIPDVASGHADDVEVQAVASHVETCSECAAELGLARALFGSRAQAPVDLSDRILTTLRRERRSLHRPWWGISAAAVAALALGIGITSRPAGQEPADVELEVVVESEEEELWLSEDGILAGAPVLETLSDEALAQLLEELAPSPTGGQA